MPESLVYEGEMSVEEREGGFVPPSVTLCGSRTGELGTVLVEHFGANRDPGATGEVPEWAARVRFTIEVVGR